MKREEKELDFHIDFEQFLVEFWLKPRIIPSIKATQNQFGETSIQFDLYLF